MAGKGTAVLLVTANVGSIFEDPSVMLKIWTEEFLSTVTRLDPKFIALHCQEVGGKNYECSMKHVEYFVRLLMSSDELRLFDKVRVYLDEDYSSAENFTALGNFYFIHESVSDVLVWDFSAMAFVPAKGKEVHSGNIEAVSTKEKSKFPQDFFPECKWSRKGFLRTRWSLNGTVFDLINIHLFHDASNFVAMESFPSVYCKNRRRALEHTLERFHKDDYGTAPFFVFGDFNFRTDAQGVVKKLAEGLTTVRVQSNRSTDHTKIQYRDADSQAILQVGKKEFTHQDHQTVFVQDNGAWLKEFDRELEPFSGRLYEFPIDFQPSYPFEEDRKKAESYMQTRCPSWCDRVLLSISAKSLVSNICEPGSVQYGLMGASTCMGDHKPVYLKMHLNSDAGMIVCGCSSGSAPCFGLFLPADATAHWPLSRIHRSSELDHSALSSMLLAARCMTVDSGGNGHLLQPPPAHALLHDPYTPESMETPSPSPTPSLTPQFVFEDTFGRESDSHEDNTQIYVPEFQQNTEDKVNKWHLVAHGNLKCMNCRRNPSIKKVGEELESENEIGRSSASIIELCNCDNIKVSCGRSPEDELKIPYIRFSDCDKIVNSSQAPCSKNIFKISDSSSLIPHICDDCSSSVLEAASPHSKELKSRRSDAQLLDKNTVLEDSATVVIHVDSASCSSELESVQIISDTAIEKLPLCQETECDDDTELQKHLANNGNLSLPENIERSDCLEGHLETYHGDSLDANNSKLLSSHFCNAEECCEIKNDLFDTANKSSIEITDPSYSYENSFPTESDKTSIQRNLKSKVSYNKVFELSNLRLLNNAISKFRNEAATVQKSSLKNLFRSASAPLYLCSSRCRVPCLFISGTHSCGDISANYNDAQNQEICFNVPSARQEQSLEQEVCRRKESDSSSNTHNLHRGSENASTSKRVDRKHFKCCVLL